VRILWWSPPPWAPSGYGVQTKLIVPQLVKMGHEVAIGAYAGVHEERVWETEFGPATILGTSGRNYGNGLVDYLYNKWDATVMVTLCDVFCLEPSQFVGKGVWPWMPIDCDPMGEPDKIWLHMATEQAKAIVHPIAMSQFGQKVLAAEGIEAGYIPHAFDPRVYYPDPDAGRAWRKEVGVPSDLFLISMCGVNSGVMDRKAFVETLVAFKHFSDQKKDVGLYLHTEAQYVEGYNLAKLALSLGLKGRVVFADEKRRVADDYNEAYMRGMYNASNVYTQTSKGEGFGVNTIEALACGTPVVASRWSAQKEIITKDVG